MMSRHKHRYLPPSPSQPQHIVLTISGIRNELFVSVMRWLIPIQCYHFLVLLQLSPSLFSEFSDCAFVSVYPHRKYYLENSDVLLIVGTRYRRYHLVFPGPLRAPGFVMIGPALRRSSVGSVSLWFWQIDSELLRNVAS